MLPADSVRRLRSVAGNAAVVQLLRAGYPRTIDPGALTSEYASIQRCRGRDRDRRREAGKDDRAGGYQRDRDDPRDRDRRRGDRDRDRDQDRDPDRRPRELEDDRDRGRLSGDRGYDRDRRRGDREYDRDRDRRREDREYDRDRERKRRAGERGDDRNPAGKTRSRDGSPDRKRARALAPDEPGQALQRTEPASVGGAFSLLPAELIVEILSWVGQVTRSFGPAFSLVPANLAAVARLNGAWRVLVRDAAGSLGYHPGLMAKVNRAAEIKAEARFNLSFRTIMKPVAMKGMREFAANLVAAYAPAEHAYVAVGNSPAPLAAYVKLHHPQVVALFLPLSGISADAVQTWDSDDTAREHMRTYLGRYVGPEMLAGRRKVLVMDIVGSGSGLLTTQALLMRFYGTAVPQVEVSILALNELETFGHTELRTRDIRNEETDRVIFEAQVIPTLKGSASQGTVQAMILSKDFKDGMRFLMWERLEPQTIFAGKAPTGGELATGELARMLDELNRVPALIKQVDDLG
jgi:hypothetical protein